MGKWIKNFDQLATSDSRKNVLEIIEAAYDAIDTEKVVKEAVVIEGDNLKIKDKTFPLSKFSSIKVLGFGKTSCKAIQVLEEVLGDRIKAGALIDDNPEPCKFVETFQGSHPKPTDDNVRASERIKEIAESATENDLVIVVVSGGGSSLLCWPQSEADQAPKLYDTFLKAGGTISELNTIRKHISGVKGGGLAGMLYPATVVSLVFCDIPGSYDKQVASGPTYKDESTIDDAKKILEKYNLKEEFDLVETPKEDKYFEKVSNIEVVCNKDALGAMASRAEELGYEAVELDSEIYDFPETVVEKFLENAKPNTVLVAGGEPRLIVDKPGGKGGRNQYVNLVAIDKITDKDIFAAFASDGRDNCDAAGSIADKITKDKAEKLGLNPKEGLETFDTYSFFEKTGDLIMTGRTEANVSDLILMLREK